MKCDFTSIMDRRGRDAIAIDLIGATPTDEYYDSIIRWHETRNHVTGLARECIGYENGVLGGVLFAAQSGRPRLGAVGARARDRGLSPE